MTYLPRIVYIMGTGRSGSTVLQALLANAANATGLGEVTHVVRDGLVHNKPCSCGHDFDACPVWSPLRERLEATMSIEDALSLRDRFERHGSLWAQLGPARARREWTAYHSLAAASLGVVGSDGVVIDSSKYASRAHALRKALGKSVRILWLTRSPAGLLQSFGRETSGEQPPKRPMSALAYYVYVTFCARVVALRYPSEVMLVRYEDLMADPEEALVRIGAWAGLDVEPIIRSIRADVPIDVGHVVTGNRLRKEGVVRLRPNLVSPPEGAEARSALAFMNLWRRVVGA